MRFLPLLLVSAVLMARPQAFDQVIPPGNNFDKAQFRLWIPNDPGTLRAALILTTGSNGDGRPMVDDPVWQSFATRYRRQ
jgi:hypothetical protein